LTPLKEKSETSEKPVQHQKKKRSQSDKIGRLKYNQQLLKQTLAEIEEVKLMLRTIFAGLKASFNFEQSLIERVACSDEVDREILLRSKPRTTSRVPIGLPSLTAKT